VTELDTPTAKNIKSVDLNATMSEFVSDDFGPIAQSTWREGDARWLEPWLEPIARTAGVNIELYIIDNRSAWSETTLNKLTYKSQKTLVTKSVAL